MPLERRGRVGYARRVGLRQAAAAFGAVALFACGSAPRAERPAPPPAAVEDAATPDPPAVAAPDSAPATTPEPARPVTTTSYEEALSTPEAVDVKDDRVQLTDAQLRGPMNAVLASCRVPRNAKVTIKTAVQNGRAIGVTVDVRIDRTNAPPPKTKKPPTKAALRAAQAATKAEAKTKAKIVSCFEHAVRSATWPPSRRRDSFVTEF